MSKRDDAATVQLKVRIKEPLRAAIEADARSRGISMNAAIIDRLERSFDHQRTITETISSEFGGPPAIAILRALASTAAAVAAFRRVNEWAIDPASFAAVRAAWDKVLNALAPDGAHAASESGNREAAGEWSPEDKQAALSAASKMNLELRGKMSSVEQMDVLGLSFRDAGAQEEK